MRNCLRFCVYGLRQGLVLICLSAVSGAPRDASVSQLHAFKGALRIQRLEGSRPDGWLCTLNGADRVQRSAQGADLGMICGPGDARQQRLVAWQGWADFVAMTFRAQKVG